MECLLERLDKGHDLLGMCLGLLRYIGVYQRKLSIEGEGSKVLQPTVERRGLNGGAECSAKLSCVGISPRGCGEGVDELLAMELIAICPKGKAML